MLKSSFKYITYEEFIVLNSFDVNDTNDLIWVDEYISNGKYKFLYDGTIKAKGYKSVSDETK